jgi:predicted nucleotidyltransferase component of viral defense system
MLTSDKLRELSVKKQTTELNIRQEYIQHVFLSYFYQQPQSEKIFFKGGTALHLLHNSPRYSEDLDFSASGADISTIETIIQNTLAEVEREGIKTNIFESKETGEREGYLAIIEFILGETKVSIQIEVSFRDKEIGGEVVTIAGDFIPAYTVVSLAQEQLVKQKIRALLSRKKPRDFYDLYYILRANLLPPQEKIIVAQVVTVLNQTDISFKKELEQFLPRSHWLQVKNFKSILVQEIQKFI